MNRSSANPKKSHPVIGWLCVCIGTGILLIALGLIPVDPATVHAPYSVLGLCGVVFFLAGVMILLGENSKYNSLGASVMLICFAIIGGWATVFASTEGMRGGLPFLSDGINVLLGKSLFGFGALVCAALAVYAFKMFRDGK